MRPDDGVQGGSEAFRDRLRNQSDTKTDLPHAPLTGGPQGSAGIAAEEKQDAAPYAPAPVSPGVNEPVVTQQVPVAPATGGQPASEQARVDAAEGGGAGQPVAPPVQYGQSAP